MAGALVACQVIPSRAPRLTPSAKPAYARNSAKATVGTTDLAFRSSAFRSGALAASLACVAKLVSRRQQYRSTVGLAANPRQEASAAEVVPLQAAALNVVNDGVNGPSLSNLDESALAMGRTGVLLINIGTPASTKVDDVRDYLSRFLGDDRVIDIEPAWLKFIVLQVLLGTRPQKSAEAYKSIWDPIRGSPLRFHTDDLVQGLQEQLGDAFMVRSSYEYSAPFTPDVLSEFSDRNVNEVVLVPMFPQYASGTVGTCLATAYNAAAEMYVTPIFKVVPPFYSETAFLHAQRDRIADVIGPNGCNVDHTLFSFHGLPEDQCSKAHVGGTKCGPDCAHKITRFNKNCYHAQCHESARRLAALLGLASSQWSVGFQSRLTLRDTVQWLRPYTDEAFVELARKGVRRLAVAAPSFTIDCLETDEELSITGKEQFQDAGGEELLVVPCLNSSATWVEGLAQLVKEAAGVGSTEASLDDNLQKSSQPGICPVSGKFGIWRQGIHAKAVQAVAAPQSA